MEILVTLENMSILYKLAEKGVDGIIFGSLFSTKFNYTSEELIIINNYCIEKNIKRYISIDTFISEDDEELLDSYFNVLAKLKLDGIYFADLAIISFAKRYGLDNILIYDPVTLMTNSRDIDFYLQNNIDVVLARELALSEIIEIVKNHPYKLDMQVFGHLRMSYSKRKFLSNYLKEIDKDVDIQNKKDITLVEESRDYKLPIVETKYGTCIYSDYIFVMYEEYAYLSKLLKRVIIDSAFIDESVLFTFIRDAKRINEENSEFLKSAFYQRYDEQYNFSSGYLYQKTVDKKEENE